MNKRTIMRKYYALLLTASVLSSMGLVTSCKDDEPYVPPKLSFSSAEITAKESDEVINVEIVLDKPASEDITIDFSLSGTAKDDVSAGSSAPADYEIDGDYGSIELAKGETTATIKIVPYSDTDIEEDETIEITIDEVSSDGIEITRDDDVTVTLQQEDGLIVALEWGLEEDGPYTDVDMDLFLWAEGDDSQLGLTNYVGYNGIYNTNLIASTSSAAEYFFLPTAGISDGMYGLSCVYYEGATDPMNFQVSFIKVVDGDDVSTEVRKGTYTVANINKWDEDDAPSPLLSITFEKSGSNFINIGTELSVQATGSRIGSGALPKDLKRNGKIAPLSEGLLKHLDK